MFKLVSSSARLRSREPPTRVARGRIRDLGVELIEGYGVDRGETDLVHLVHSYDGRPLAIEATVGVHALPHTADDGLVARLRKWTPWHADARRAPARGRDPLRVHGVGSSV